MGRARLWGFTLVLLVLCGLCAMAVGEYSGTGEPDDPDVINLLGCEDCEKEACYLLVNTSGTWFEMAKACSTFFEGREAKLLEINDQKLYDRLINKISLEMGPVSFWTGGVTTQKNVYWRTSGLDLPDWINLDRGTEGSVNQSLTLTLTSGASPGWAFRDWDFEAKAICMFSANQEQGSTEPQDESTKEVPPTTTPKSSDGGETDPGATVQTSVTAKGSSGTENLSSLTSSSIITTSNGMTGGSTPSASTGSTSTAITSRSTTWSSTAKPPMCEGNIPVGQVRNESHCRAGYKGQVTSLCALDRNGQPYFRKSIENCWSIALDELANQANKGDPLTVVTNLTQVTEGTLLGAEITLVLNIADVLQDRFFNRTVQGDAEDVLDFSEKILDVVNSLIRVNNTKGWKEVSKGKTFGKLLKTVESLGQRFVCLPNTNDTTDDFADKTIVKGNIEFETMYISESDNTVFPKGESRSHISHPPYQRNPTQTFCRGGTQLTAVGTIFKNMEHIWGRDPNDEREENDLEEDEGNSTRFLNSAVIALTTENETRLNYSEPVTIVLEITNKDFKDPVCVFWNYAEMKWDTENCWLNESLSNRTSAVCRCSHLTNFAVLMMNPNPADAAALKIVSIICCSISILALIVTIACFTAFRSLRSRRNTITCNLSVTLILVNTLILVGLDRTENQVVCKIMAMTLHYFLLSSFTWMLMEAFILYQMIVVVFSKVLNIPVAFFYAAGYGLPLLIVAVSGAVNFNGYGSDKYCWLSSEGGMIWSFHGPIIAIIAVNSVVFCCVMRAAISARQSKNMLKSSLNAPGYIKGSSSMIKSIVFCCKRRTAASAEDNNKQLSSQNSTKSPQNAPGYVKGSFSMMCILGIAWILAYFSIGDSSIFMAYAFTVINASQGVFIFIFHVIFNEKTRTTIIRFYKGRKSSAIVTSSTRTRLNTRSSWFSSRNSSSKTPNGVLNGAPNGSPNGDLKRTLSGASKGSPNGTLNLC